MWLAERISIMIRIGIGVGIGIGIERKQMTLNAYLVDSGCLNWRSGGGPFWVEMPKSV